MALPWAEREVPLAGRQIANHPENSYAWYQTPLTWRDIVFCKSHFQYLWNSRFVVETEVLSHYVLWNTSPTLANLLGLAKGKDSKYKHKVITLKLSEPSDSIMHGLPDTLTTADECFWNL